MAGLQLVTSNSPCSPGHPLEARVFHLVPVPYLTTRHCPDCGALELDECVCSDAPPVLPCEQQDPADDGADVDSLELGRVSVDGAFVSGTSLEDSAADAAAALLGRWPEGPDEHPVGW
jgi:hypothetical protein